MRKYEEGTQIASKISSNVALEESHQLWKRNIQVSKLSKNKWMMRHDSQYWNIRQFFPRASMSLSVSIHRSLEVWKSVPCLVLHGIEKCPLYFVSWINLMICTDLLESECPWNLSMQKMPPLLAVILLEVLHIEVFDSWQQLLFEQKYDLPIHLYLPADQLLFVWSNWCSETNSWYLLAWNTHTQSQSYENHPVEQALEATAEIHLTSPHPYHLVEVDIWTLLVNQQSDGIPQ